MVSFYIQVRTCCTKTSCVSCNIVGKDDGSHARLARTTFTHKQYLKIWTKKFIYSNFACWNRKMRVFFLINSTNKWISMVQLEPTFFFMFITRCGNNHCAQWKYNQLLHDGFFWQLICFFLYLNWIRCLNFSVFRQMLAKKSVILNNSRSYHVSNKHQMNCTFCVCLISFLFFSSIWRIYRDMCDRWFHSIAHIVSLSLSQFICCHFSIRNCAYRWRYQIISFHSIQMIISMISKNNWMNFRLNCMHIYLNGVRK